MIGLLAEARPSKPCLPRTPVPRPLDIGFELTNLCNLHCRHCIRGSHQERLEYLDLALFRRVLDQASHLFTPLRVAFTGGEPLAADLFPGAVEELRARGLPYWFVTNGWLLPRHLPLLLRHPPLHVRISLSGGSAKTHDGQRGKGSFRRALLGAAVLLSRRIRTEMSMVVTRDGRDELRDALTLASKLGVGALHFILPQPTPETALEGSDLSPAEWDSVTDEVRELSRCSAVPVFLDYGTSEAMPRRICRSMAARQLYIDARGQVAFCCQLSRYGTGPDPILGDLTTESLEDVFAHAEATYAGFGAETTRLHQIGQTDALDAYPCLSCARRHGKTGFLADFPDHPWTALSRAPA